MTVWGELLLSSLLSAIAQLCQKKAALHHQQGLPPYPFYLWLCIALGLLSLSMLCWLQVLRTLPVGIAYPLLSLNYLWVISLSRLLWREPISRRQYLGIFSIILGTLLLGGSY